jgi:acetamidase/formamidase
VNLTALECAYKEIEIRAVVRKNLETEWPWAETKADWIFLGFDEDLDEAMKIAVEQTVRWVSTQTFVPMSREESYALTSLVGDCRVSQVVDIRKGVHCMIPKSVFVKLNAHRGKNAVLHDNAALQDRPADVRPGG